MSDDIEEKDEKDDLKDWVLARTIGGSYVGKLVHGKIVTAPVTVEGAIELKRARTEYAAELVIEPAYEWQTMAVPGGGIAHQFVPILLMKSLRRVSVRPFAVISLAGLTKSEADQIREMAKNAETTREQITSRRGDPNSPIIKPNGQRPRIQ